MQALQDKDIKKHFLYPGMLLAESEPHAITTILGSCISVCLWDSVLKTGGMNHYLLPFWNCDGLKTPKYGNVAIPALVEKMLSLGSERRNLKAKIFGGAKVLNNSSGLLNVGERNVLLAEEALAREKIPIVSRSTGGVEGRKISFLTTTGGVLLKKIKRTENFPSAVKGRVASG